MEKKELRCEGGVNQWPPHLTQETLLMEPGIRSGSLSLLPELAKITSERHK